MRFFPFLFVGLLLASALPVAYAQAAYSPSAGDLVKGSGTSVYYVTVEGKRLAFPDEAAYFSWYEDFSAVQTVSDEEMASLPLGGLVTLRPGTALVKVPNNPKVYAVGHGGVLCWVSNESIAQMIYGTDWAKKIVPLPEEFLTAYTIGIDITGPGQYWWKKEMDASPSVAFDRDAALAPENLVVIKPVEVAPPDTVKPPDPPKEEAPAVVKVQNVLFVLFDPQRPQHAAFDKSAFQRVVYDTAPGVADYFKVQSNGKFMLANVGILGWYKADKPAEHYWSDDSSVHLGDGFKTGAAERIAEPLIKADLDFDFKKYDTNNDGTVSTEELAVIVAIPQSGDPADGTATPSLEEDPSVKNFIADGVTISKVGAVYVGAPVGEAKQLGTVSRCIASYVLGLSEISANTGGNFSLMGSPRSDLQLDPYSRIKLGWISATVIPKIQEISDHTLTSAQDKHPVIRIDRDQPGGPALGAEYFLLENRQRGIYDNSLPDTGIAIWDVNGSSLNLLRLSSYSFSGSSSTYDDKNTLWRQNSSFSAPTGIELRWADGTRSGVQLQKVGASAEVMSFTLVKKILTELDLQKLDSPLK